VYRISTYIWPLLEVDLGKIIHTWNILVNDTLGVHGKLLTPLTKAKSKMDHGGTVIISLISRVLFLLDGLQRFTLVNHQKIILL
jgi:hypothetical protein